MTSIGNKNLSLWTWSLRVYKKSYNFRSLREVAKNINIYHVLAAENSLYVYTCHVFADFCELEKIKSVFPFVLTGTHAMYTTAKIKTPDNGKTIFLFSNSCCAAA